MRNVHTNASGIYIYIYIYILVYIYIYIYILKIKCKQFNKTKLNVFTCSKLQSKITHACIAHIYDIM